MNRQIDSIPTNAVEALGKYHWPGNVRELQNLVERSVIMTHGRVLRLEMPAEELPSREFRSSSAHEREVILRALKEAGGVIGGPSGAAARLGLRRTTLQSRMKRLQIGREYR